MFSIFCMFYKMYFVPWNSSNDFVEGRLISLEPRFSVMGGLFMFIGIPSNTDRGENAIEIRAVVSCGLTQKGNNRRVGQWTFNTFEEVSLIEFVVGFSGPFAIIVVCAVVSEFRQASFV